jgi:hypothetical protein
MVEVALIGFGGILFFEMLIAWIKAISDERYDPNDWKYCKDCECGFCTEIPKTDGCKRWEDEKRGEH